MKIEHRMSNIEYRSKQSASSAESAVEKTNPMPASGRKLEFLNPKSETRIDLVFILRQAKDRVRGSFQIDRCSTMHKYLQIFTKMHKNQRDAGSICVNPPQKSKYIVFIGVHSWFHPRNKPNLTEANMQNKPNASLRLQIRSTNF